MSRFHPKKAKVKLAYQFPLFPTPSHPILLQIVQLVQLAPMVHVYDIMMLTKQNPKPNTINHNSLHVKFYHFGVTIDQRRHNGYKKALQNTTLKHNVPFQELHYKWVISGKRSTSASSISFNEWTRIRIIDMQYYFFFFNSYTFSFLRESFFGKYNYKKNKNKIRKKNNFKSFGCYI